MIPSYVVVIVSNNSQIASRPSSNPGRGGKG